MRILIIGGGGFLGSKLARSLVARGRLAGRAIQELVLADLAAPTTMDASLPMRGVPLDITRQQQVDALFQQIQPDVVYLLAAVVSGQAEAEFDVGMAVNLQGSIKVFEAARSLGTGPIVVFTSSIAVYGGEVPEPIADWTALNPQTSYGAQKAAAEMLLTDYSRRGFLDGRGLRLPTISIRPGKPNRAASSFMSSIFREPLQGQEAICPVAPEFEHWYLSPRRCIENLIHAAEVQAGDLGSNRCFALPGCTHSIGAMVEALRRVAGNGPVGRIRWEPDPEIQKIVLGWKARFAPAKALALGFKGDSCFEDNIRYFLEDDIEPAR